MISSQFSKKCSAKECCLLNRVAADENGVANVEEKGMFHDSRKAYRSSIQHKDNTKERNQKKIAQRRVEGSYKQAHRSLFHCVWSNGRQ